MNISDSIFKLHFVLKTGNFMVRQSGSDKIESQVTKCKFNGFLPRLFIYYGRRAILPHLGHYKNDTVWPYFDQRAPGFKNMAHTGI